MPELFNAKKHEKDVNVAYNKVEKEIATGKKEKDPEGVEHGPYRLRKSHKVNPLNAYAFMPKNVNFVTKETEEKVVLLLRKHPITNIGWIITALIMFLAPLVLSNFPILDFLPDRYRFVAIFGWYMISLAFILQNFLTWFFNVNIVTDERIVDIDFVSLIYREISEAKVDNIQDVTTKMGSVIRTIFNYGDVLIQTASEVPNIEFVAVPKPDKVSEVLRGLQVEEEQEKLEGRVR